MTIGDKTLGEFRGGGGRAEALEFTNTSGEEKKEKESKGIANSQGCWR